MPDYSGRGHLLSIISVLLIVFSAVTLIIYGMSFVMMFGYMLGLIAQGTVLSVQQIVLSVVVIVFALFELKTGMVGMNYRSKEVCIKFGRINMILVLAQCTINCVQQAQNVINHAQNATTLGIVTAWFPVILPVLYLLGVQKSADK